MSATPKLSSREEEAIHARSDEFVNGWNTHNPRAMSALYAEDADVINPFGRVAKGRTEIERLFKDEHSGPLKDSHMSVRPESIRLLTPEVAITDHSFEITGIRDPHGKDVPTMRGHITEVLKKSGDMWLAVACRPMVPLPNPGGR
jgi:uncharacterized protein (TIGR02246 family)